MSKNGEWDYEEIGSRSTKSVFYTIGLFKWVLKDGQVIRTNSSRFVIGFKDNIPLIREKAKEACEKFNQGIVNRQFIIYADKKAKIRRKGDIPIGTRTLNFNSVALRNYQKVNPMV